MASNLLPSSSREDPPEGGEGVPDNHCYRHQQDFPFQKLAEAAAVQAVHELQTLPPESRERIASTWALFSNAPDEERRLLIDGILARCHSSQLSGISASIEARMRVDLLAVLPTELSCRILQHLDATTLCRAAQVSQLWRSLADDDIIWCRMCEQHINRKCSICGWSLPLLRRQERPAGSHSLGRSEGSLGISSNKVDGSKTEVGVLHSHESSTISSPLAKRQRVFEHAVELNSPCYPPRPQTRPWKEVYKERFQVGLNWKYGRYKKTVLKGHDRYILCVQIHNNFIATASVDTVRLWDLDSGENIRTFVGHTSAICGLQFDGHKIISGSLDRTIKIWNWQTGHCVRTIPCDHEVTGLDVAGNMLAAIFDISFKIRIWNFETGEAFTLRGHTDNVVSVKLDSASRTLISASQDETMRLWDLHTRECIRTFEGHSAPGQLALFLPPEIEDEPALEPSFSACVLAEGTPQRSTRSSYGIGFSSHPERPLPPLYVMSSDADSTLRLWNTATGVCVRVSSRLDSVWDAAALSGMRAVYSGGVETTIWDVVTGETVITLPPHEVSVNCAALTDSVVVTGSVDGSVTVYDFTLDNAPR